MPGARGGRTFVNPNFSQSSAATSEAITTPGRQAATSNDARSGDNSLWPTAGGRPPRRQRDNRPLANSQNESAEASAAADSAQPNSGNNRGRRSGGGARNRRGGGRTRPWSPSMEAGNFGTNRAQANQSTDLRAISGNWAMNRPARYGGNPWNRPRNAESATPALSTRTTAGPGERINTNGPHRRSLGFQPQRWDPMIDDEWGDDVDQENQALPSGFATDRPRASTATGRRNGGARATPHPWGDTDDSDAFHLVSYTPPVPHPPRTTSSRGARGGGRNSNTRGGRAVASATTTGRNSQGWGNNDDDDSLANAFWDAPESESRPTRGGRGRRGREASSATVPLFDWRQPSPDPYSSPPPSYSPPGHEHWSTNASDGYDRDHAYSPPDWAAEWDYEAGERDVVDWWSPQTHDIPRIARDQRFGGDGGSGFGRAYVQQPQSAASTRGRRNRRRTRAAAAARQQEQLMRADNWAPPDYHEWGLSGHHDSLENITVWGVHGDQWERGSVDDVDWMDLIEHVRRHHVRDEPTEGDAEKQERLQKIREVDNQKDTLAMKYSRSCGICITPNPRIRFALKECGHILCAYCVEQVERCTRDRVYCPYCRSVTGYVRIWETVEEESAEAAAAAPAEVSQA
ncbi:hypothetical protein PMAYCL1PPCAC_25160 [Pristionchus mayeri]|uniref:RING-type domain-containing protein n=1 Tax=Pristionchus mayeri TaxID=1317129 RepID=A0AAN5D2P5_9BILA|nr:hypothetical protein PMAYCL1PPCAC_25160 [Pristionchus mayeri]